MYVGKLFFVKRGSLKLMFFSSRLWRTKNGYDF